MLEKLSLVEEHYEEINRQLADPAVIGDQDLYRKLMKEHKNMTPVVEKYREYKKVEQEQADAQELMADGAGPGRVL